MSRRLVTIVLVAVGLLAACTPKDAVRVAERLSVSIESGVSPSDDGTVVPSCADGYVHVMSVGGPLCVGAIYVDPNSPIEWEDPATCEHGYYQGSCV